MKNEYLFEAVRYSPRSREFYHYCVVGVLANSLEEARHKAYAVLMMRRKTTMIGDAKIDLRYVKNKHHEWASGFDLNRDPILRENPVSKGQLLMRPYLFEAVWISPHSHETYHYCIVDVDADNLQAAEWKAEQVLKKHGKKPWMGKARVTLRSIGPVHRWGTGYKPGRNAILRENPVSKETMDVVYRVGLVAAAAALIYYSTRSTPAAASSPVPAPAPTPSSGGGATTPTSTPQTYSATEAQGGQTFAMHVGDTLSVDLSVMAPIADYSLTASGSGLTAGTYANLGDSAMQPWTASSAGTEVLSYQPVDGSGAPQGNPVVFTVTVT